MKWIVEQEVLSLTQFRVCKQQLMMPEDIKWLASGYTASKWLSKEQYQGVLKPHTQLLGAFQLSKLSEPDQSQIGLSSENMVI